MHGVLAKSKRELLSEHVRRPSGSGKPRCRLEWPLVADQRRFWTSGSYRPVADGLDL